MSRVLNGVVAATMLGGFVGLDTASGQSRSARAHRVAYSSPAGTAGVSLTTRELHRIDQAAMKLIASAEEIETETSAHFRGERHSEKLATDAHRLNVVANRLHDELHLSHGTYSDVRRLRSAANDFIEIVARLPRTIELLQQQPLGPYGRDGIRHLKSAYREAHETAMEIDRYLPADNDIVDRQATHLRMAVEQLHREFHEHLEQYELSSRIDHELEKLDNLADHVRSLAANPNWQRLGLRHLDRDVSELRSSTRRIESLMNLQVSRGVASRDLVGVEHVHDSVTDIHASAYLLEHMIAKLQTNSYEDGYSPSEHDLFGTSRRVTDLRTAEPTSLPLGRRPGLDRTQ